MKLYTTHHKTKKKTETETTQIEGTGHEPSQDRNVPAAPTSFSQPVHITNGGYDISRA